MAIARERIEAGKRAKLVEAEYTKQSFGYQKLLGAAGTATAVHANAIGAAIGGREGGLGAVAAEVGLDLAQQVGPMFGPVGVAFAGAAKAASVGLDVLQAASRQAAKNITDYGAIQAQFVSGDVMGARKAALEKEQEERNSGLKAAAVFGLMGPTLAKWWKGTSFNSPGQRAAAIGAQQQMDASMMAQAKNLAPYSPAISAALATSNAKQIQARVHMAAEAGPSLAQAATKYSNFQLAMEQAANARKVKIYERMAQMTTEQRADPELLRQLAALNDKAKINELLYGSSEDSKAFLKEIASRVKKIQESDKQEGDFTMTKLIERAQKNSNLLPGAPANDPLAAPDFARQNMIQPLGGF